MKVRKIAHFRLLAALIMVAAALLAFQPRKAHAIVTICEPDMFIALPLTSTIADYLDCWWHREFRPSLEDHAEHISLMILEHSRMSGGFFDAQNATLMQMEHKHALLEATRRHRPSDMGCVAGTFALGLTRSGMTASTIRLALNKDHLARAANRENSPGESAVYWLGMHWNEFQNNFCDEDMNFSGWPGACLDASGDDADVLVGHTLMANKTLDTDEEFRAAVALSRHLIEPKIPDPIVDAGLAGPKGKQIMLERRAQFAHRQALHDVVGTILGKRAPGSRTGPWLKDMLGQSGFDIATVGDNPSYNEVMSAMARVRFEDPQYFVRLSDDPEMAARERLATSAYKLLTLREQYELLEKIALNMALELTRRF